MDIRPGATERKTPDKPASLSLKSRLRGFIEPTFDSADERRFCQSWYQQFQTRLGKLAANLVIVFHFWGGIFTFMLPMYFFSNPVQSLPELVNLPVVKVMMTYHGSWFAIALLGYAIVRNNPKRLRTFVFIGAILSNVTYLLCLLGLQNSEMTVLVALVISQTCYALVSLVLFTASVPAGFLTAAVFCLVATPLLMTSPIGSFVAVEYAICTLFGLAFQLTLYNLQIKGAKKEYRARISIAPAQIVRENLDFSNEIEDIFTGGDRTCICLASDWRGYQELTKGKSSESVAKLLSAYYDECESLLARHFPDGNYYSDWIADELFIVIFTSENEKLGSMTQSSIRFAEDLIAAKNTFAQRENLNLKIDVGLALGTAYLGLMGPRTHRKATALGEIPGRARRIQSTGKLLRQRLGDRDRVVFGKEVLMQIRIPVDVCSLDVAESKLRDLDDTSLFFLESEATAKESAPCASAQDANTEPKAEKNPSKSGLHSVSYEGV